MYIKTTINYNIHQKCIRNAAGTLGNPYQTAPQTQG